MSIPGRIGRYRVIDFLGQGAMGVVYRGRDEALERDVALKVMLGHGADADARTRFLREAKAAAKLQHPNIVTIYELGEHEGAPFMAMELLEGVDLQRAIEGGLRPNPKKTLPIVLQLLSGLEHAHEHGIVHRDVKPSNIFLPRGRPAKIMDFGVARLAGGGTTSGAVVGTPNYMSPEQVRAESIDGRSDLFSAGLILYELVTGEKAYRADSVVALMYKIAHEAPNFSLIPRGPEWERLRKVLARAVARKPADRYADARAMATELALALQDLGGTADWATASDVGVMVRTTPRPAPMVPVETPLPPAQEAPLAAQEPAQAAPSQPSLRAPLLAASGFLVAAVFLFGLTLFVLHRSQAPAASTAPAPAATPRLAAAIPASTPASPPSAVAAAKPTPVPVARSSPTPTPAEVAVSPEETPEQPTEETLPPAPAPETARLDHANELFEKGRYAAALQEAKAVLRRDPRNEEAKTLVEDAEVEIVVETRSKEARAALKRGDMDAALEAARNGLAVKPTDARLIALFREATQ